MCGNSGSESLTSVQRMMGMEQVFAIETFEAASVPDSVFTLPDQIKALIGQ